MHIHCVVGATTLITGSMRNKNPPYKIWSRLFHMVFNSFTRKKLEVCEHTRIMMVVVAHNVSVGVALAVSYLSMRCINICK